MRLKISAHVDGEPSGGSSMRRPQSKDPIGMIGNLFCILTPLVYFTISIFKPKVNSGVLEYYSCIFIFSVEEKKVKFENF